MRRYRIRVTAEPHASKKAMPLTWAQANMWEYILAFGERSQESNLWLPVVLSPPYPHVDQAVERLSRFCADAEITRTVFDTSLAFQTVRACLELPLHTAEADGDEDAEPASIALLADMAQSAFRLSEEPPIRFGMVTKGEEVRALALLLSHLAFDGPSAKILGDLVVRYMGGGREEMRQPADLVFDEASDRMRDRSDATLQYWTRSLSALPTGRGLRFAAPGEFTQWELRSRALAIAAQRISVRASVSTPSVVLAALSVVLRQVLSEPPHAMLLICSNRQYPDLARYAGIAVGNALYPIPEYSPASGFDAYTIAAHQTAFRSYTKARYDSARWRTMLGEMSRQGTAPDLSFYFNDARADTAAWNGLEHEVGELKSWRGSPENITVRSRSHVNDATMFVHIRGNADSARLAMVCDDAIIPPARAPEILHQLEEFLVRHAR